MKLIEKLLIKFDDADHFIDTVKNLCEKNLLETDKFSEDIFFDYSWKEESISVYIPKVIEKLSEYLNFKILSKNINIPWTYTLLDKYKDELNWDVKELYQTMTTYNQITLQFIEHFKSYLNWELLGKYGIVRRDVNLELLLAYKEKWHYKPNIDDSDVDVDPDFGIKGSFRSKRNTIFNNNHIPWHNKEYQIAFEDKIIIYIDTLKKHFGDHLRLQAGVTTEFVLEYRLDMRMFVVDELE